MRTNNSKVKNTIISIYFVLIVLAILLATFYKLFNNLTGNPFFTFFIIVFAFALLYFLAHMSTRYFEYDSDGSKVIVVNRGLLLPERFDPREHVLEFEKEELYAYKFRNMFLYKTLTFYLEDQHSRKYKDTFNVTLLPRKKRRYIKQSLRKMIKQNKQEAELNE